jgi:hypothetical protein
MKSKTECLKAPVALVGMGGASCTPSFFHTIPGVYLTRGGKEVEIHERREGSYFPIKGSVRHLNKNGVLHHRQYDVWTENGCHDIMGEAPLDIVGEVNHV